MVLLVAPYVGAWIETFDASGVGQAYLSHPTWVRGLKHAQGTQNQHRCRVAPYVGAWIETEDIQILHRGAEVAPYVGAWIETWCYWYSYYPVLSHPTWVRGLKHI